MLTLMDVKKMIRDSLNACDLPISIKDIVVAIDK